MSSNDTSITWVFRIILGDTPKVYESSPLDPDINFLHIEGLMNTPWVIVYH